MIFADIIVDISHEKLDKTFQYIIPTHLEKEIYPGVLVKIPFGKGNRLLEGYVIHITDKPVWEVDKMKEIISVETQKVPIESTLIRLAWFIREHYGSTMNQALKVVIPVKDKVRSVETKTVSFTTLYQIGSTQLSELKAQTKKKNAVARMRLFTELEKKTSLDYTYVTKTLKLTAKTLQELEEKGILNITRETSYRNPISFLEKSDTEEEKSIILNQEQKNVINGILSSEKSVHLIHGITGSGKTQIYIELIKEVIAQGKQAIVMIPEISLTYQTVMRFYQVFGERVSIIHSKLSQGERYDQFERAKNGDLDIIIGPRSALFTPFSDLGMIIMDEEHDTSYKSESVPKYHTREVAIFRANMCGAKLVLGSATPSLEAYYYAQKGEYELYQLKTRAAGGEMARVSVVDLRQELADGNRSIFSRQLHELITDRLAKKEQIMLFINRRGYAGFVSCRSCGEVIKCPHCDVSLTYHKEKDEILVCHYCGHEIAMPKICPKCSSKYIAKFGTGTQKVEEMVRKIYPSARVLRMDADTTSKKNGHETILKQFREHQADILIGTQMIVKGHDFPLVTLVGVIAADLSLYASDYRAGERTFALLTQAEGRAGRQSKGGEAVIQTYNPEEFCIVAAANQNYEEFYQKEILYRTLAEYPPIVSMMAVLVMSKEEERCQTICNQMKDLLETYDCKMVGPAKAGISKIADVYRYIFYLKHPNKEILIDIKNVLETYLKEYPLKKEEGCYFDLNPVNGY